MNNKKYLINIIVFFTIIAFFSFGFLLKETDEFSASERRALQDFPTMNIDTIVSGKFTKQYEKYLLDQFMFRDGFRGINSNVRFNLLNFSDYNNLYMNNDYISNFEPTMDEKQIKYAISRVNYVIDKYLQDSEIYYSIIPDKNYFMHEFNNTISYDYHELEKLVSDNINSDNYISIFDDLSLDSYYKTDLHWDQSKIIDVANTLLSGMDNPMLSDINNYTVNTLQPFNGVYYGQLGMNIDSESLLYLTNDTIENCVVTSAEINGDLKIYDDNDFNNVDSYDVYLKGAQAVLEITNPNSTNDKELIIFRDSFTSSLTPLMIESYSKITLLDLRYIHSDILSQYVTFDGQDVLFLYSTTILNNGAIFK